MAYRLLRAADAFWRPSNQMRVENTDLGKQLEAELAGGAALAAGTGPGLDQAPPR